MISRIPDWQPDPQQMLALEKEGSVYLELKWKTYTDLINNHPDSSFQIHPSTLGRNVVVGDEVIACAGDKFYVLSWRESEADSLQPPEELVHAYVERDAVALLHCHSGLVVKIPFGEFQEYLVERVYYPRTRREPCKFPARGLIRARFTAESISFLILEV